MEFWDFLKSYIAWQLVGQVVFSISISNNHFPFQLLWKKHLVKYPLLLIPTKCMLSGGLILGVNSFIFDSLWQLIAKYDRYYKMRQLFYYRMRQEFITKCARFLLQNATALLENATIFITKCNNYYKVRRLLQIATVHSFT